MRRGIRPVFARPSICSLTPASYDYIFEAMLDDYRREYTDFNSALMREYYLFYSGQKVELTIAPIFERYSDLFTKDSIARLKQSLDETSDHFETDRAGINHFLIFAMDIYLANSVKELTEQISDMEAGATVEWMDRKITFQDLMGVIKNEADRPSRREIYRLRLAVIDSSNDLRAERLTRLHEGARSLGYSSYTKLYEELFNLDYRALAEASKSLLARTEAVYIARLDEVVRRSLGITVEEAERSDAMYFLHLNEYDDRFPADNLLQVYRDTMLGLGIDVDQQKNITIDSEPRPRKNPRAFCMPITIPTDVRLVLRPMGGQADYQALLHEGGHAQHYGWASDGLRPEFKYTGDYALTETYAFLFNNLISDRAWLGQFLNLRDNDEFIRSVMLSRLVTIRRYTAKLIYERELHESDDLGKAPAFYSEQLTSATFFNTEPTEFLSDLDDSFYAASYLRAWAFEVALREHLKERFGSSWWNSHRAGNFLKEIWETGDRYTADEMAGQIGLGPIAFDLLTDELNRALK